MPIKFCCPAILVALILVAGSASADPPAAGKSGLEALGRGDNEAAARLFSQALLYGSLPPSGREFIYVKRAEAFLALGRPADAMADARRALALDPTDAEARDVSRKVRPAAAIASPGATPARLASAEPSNALNTKVKAGLDAVAARNKAAFEKYQADVADYEARKAAIAAQTKANDEAYAASLAAHQAKVEELEKNSVAAVADWQKRVEACEHGDRSQCAHSPSPLPPSPPSN